MTAMKNLLLLVFLSIIYGCSHPIEIVGEGDVLSITGTRNCSLEDFQAGRENCTKNLVQGEYKETYYAVPRSGWEFSQWINYCADAVKNECAFSIPANAVQKNWFKTMPSLRAIFVRAEPTPIDDLYAINTSPPGVRCSDGSSATEPSLHYYITAKQTGSAIRLRRDFIPKIPGLTNIDQSDMTGTIDANSNFSVAWYTTLSGSGVIPSSTINSKLQGKFSDSGWSGSYLATREFTNGIVCETTASFNGDKGAKSIGGIWYGPLQLPDGETVNAFGLSTDWGELRFITGGREQVVGTLTITGNQFGATIFTYAPFGTTYWNGSTVLNGNANGNFTPRTRVKGSSVLAGSIVSNFDFSYVSIYERDSSLSKIAGTYSRSDGLGFTETYVVDGNGFLSGGDTTGCVYRGRASIIDSSFNMYRLEVTISDCSEFNGSYSGLAAMMDLGGSANDTITYSVTGPWWILSGSVPKI